MRKQKKIATLSLTKENLFKIFKQESRPLAFGDLQKVFTLYKQDKRSLRRFLRELIHEGAIVRLRNNRFGIPHEMNLETGTLWCTRSGNGFVIPDRESERDIFIPSKFIGHAFH
ncbi:MAG TPA: hypothetical protein VGJ94_15855, partial [Syntrophorhabdaceae bacterium]